MTKLYGTQRVLGKMQITFYEHNSILKVAASETDFNTQTDQDGALENLFCKLTKDHRIMAKPALIEGKNFKASKNASHYYINCKLKSASYKKSTGNFF